MDGSYLRLAQNGELEKRIAEATARLENCELCPRRCGIDRLAGDAGYCRTGRHALVASYGPHFGEESVLVGSGGSGTVFFCGCNLLCRFCQNYDISHVQAGCHAMNDLELAAVMVELQHQGCHNINLVTPSHVVPQILAALAEAVSMGLTVPLVYNCGGYELVDSLLLLEGIIDVYMPDVKFWRRESAMRYADAPDYQHYVRTALKEMQRQVGDLQTDNNGLATKGLLVRHLLMPGGLAEAEAIFKFLAEEVSKNCFLNIMDQYHPCGEAESIDGLENMITAEYHEQARQAARRVGLSRLDEKDFGSIIRRLLGH
ncbi:MAG: radical SAM protein [Desulforhopalus sp.]